MNYFLSLCLCFITCASAAYAELDLSRYKNRKIPFVGTLDDPFPDEPNLVTCQSDTPKSIYIFAFVPRTPSAKEKTQESSYWLVAFDKKKELARVELPEIAQHGFSPLNAKTLKCSDDAISVELKNEDSHCPLIIEYSLIFRKKRLSILKEHVGAPFQDAVEATDQLLRTRSYPDAHKKFREAIGWQTRICPDINLVYGLRFFDAYQDALKIQKQPKEANEYLLDFFEWCATEDRETGIPHGPKDRMQIPAIRSAIADLKLDEASKNDVLLKSRLEACQKAVIDLPVKQGK